jgi:hypothetical protein
VSTEVEWRWAEADGSTHQAPEAELRLLLESGRLPPYVLVWRKGWGGWLSARNVAELASSLGPHAQRAMHPIQMPGLGQPPRPPISKYRAKPPIGAAQSTAAAAFSSGRATAALRSASASGSIVTLPAPAGSIVALPAPAGSIVALSVPASVGATTTQRADPHPRRDANPGR